MLWIVVLLEDNMPRFDPILLESLQKGFLKDLKVDISIHNASDVMKLANTPQRNAPLNYNLSSIKFLHLKSVFRVVSTTYPPPNKITAIRVQ